MKNKAVKTKFVVVPHPTRDGFTIQARGKKLSWITGPGQTFGWYRLKRDATRRAKDYGLAGFSAPSPGKKLLVGAVVVGGALLYNAMKK